MAGEAIIRSSRGFLEIIPVNQVGGHIGCPPFDAPDDIRIGGTVLVEGDIAPGFRTNGKNGLVKRSFHSGNGLKTLPRYR